MVSDISECRSGCWIRIHQAARPSMTHCLIPTSTNLHVEQRFAMMRVLASSVDWCLQAQIWVLLRNSMTCVSLRDVLFDILKADLCVEQRSIILCIRPASLQMPSTDLQTLSCMRTTDSGYFLCHAPLIMPFDVFSCRSAYSTRIHNRPTRNSCRASTHGFPKVD